MERSSYVYLQTLVKFFYSCILNSSLKLHELCYQATETKDEKKKKKKGR